MHEASRMRRVRGRAAPQRVNCRLDIGNNMTLKSMIKAPKNVDFQHFLFTKSMSVFFSQSLECRFCFKPFSSSKYLLVILVGLPISLLLPAPLSFNLLLWCVQNKHHVCFLVKVTVVSFSCGAHFQAHLLYQMRSNLFVWCHLSHYIFKSSSASFVWTATEP